MKVVLEAYMQLSREQDEENTGVLNLLCYMENGNNIRSTNGIVAMLKGHCIWKFLEVANNK